MIFPRHILRATTLALMVSAGLYPSVLRAQKVAGVGDDAIPVPKGGYRILVGGLWNDYDALFTPNGAESKRGLLSGLSTTSFGIANLPQLTSAQASIRALTGNGNFALSMGPLDVRGEVRQSIAPISLDYGITRRLSMRVLVPYAESRDVSQLRLNTAGTGANVGRNPAFGTTGAAARATNGALSTQIEAARTALAAELTRCASTTATSCDAIRANPAGAQALIARAQATRGNLVTLYGDATRGGSPVVPITGSSVHASVVSTIDALRSDFRAYGISTIAEGAQPAAALSVYGPAAPAGIARDTAFGIGYQELGNTRRAGIGDVDLTATYLLFDTFGADQVKRLLSPTRGIRSNVTLGWRFGTAGADRTEDAFDVPIGEGANALLVRSTTDLLLNKRVWMSATVRGVQPLADRVAAIVPFRDEASTFAGPLVVASAERKLGTRLEVELAPRLSIGDFFGVSAAYLLRHWGRDSYDASASAPSTLPSTGAQFTAPSRTLSAASLGLSFSTLSSYVRGRSRFPAEVIYTHTMPLAASGGEVPAVSTDRLELRVYTGFPRR